MLFFNSQNLGTTSAEGQEILVARALQNASHTVEMVFRRPSAAFPP
jgi:hypothetical protein